jgi:hypothetical protein
MIIVFESIWVLDRLDLEIEYMEAYPFSRSCIKTWMAPEAKFKGLDRHSKSIGTLLKTKSKFSGPDMQFESTRT